MKKLLSTLSLLFLVSQVNAQSAKFAWNTTIGSSGNEQGNSVVTDPMGFVYTVGKFSGTVDFDPGPGTYFLTAFGQTDAYVTKQDPNGAFLWARKFGGGTADEAVSIVLDPLNNIYITGNFSGVADFDPGGAGGFLSASGGVDIFTVKLEANGFFQWVRRLGGNGPDIAKSSHWEKSGFVYVAGTYFLMAGLEQAVVWKIDPNGTSFWARTIGTDAADISNSVGTDKFGNVYTIGTFEGSGDFNFTGGVDKFGSLGMKDIFITKLSAGGGYIWTKQIGGLNDEIGRGIQVTDSGYIYITGSFSGKTDFDPSPLEADTNYIESRGVNDMFIAKLDLDGDVLWVKTVGEEDADCAGMSVKTDLSGNVVVSGVFTDSLNFNPSPWKMFEIKSAGAHDVFIAKYDYAGNPLWVKQFGGAYEDSCMGMTIEMSGSILTIGTFRDSVDFNPAKEMHKMGSVGASDVFVNKMVYCVPVYTTIKDTMCEPFTLDGITYDKTGVYFQTITGLTGCEEFVSLDIEVRDLNDTISKSGVVLTSHANGLKYQWIECTSKKEIPGATGKSYIALGNNKYAVTLFDGKCRDTSDCIEISSFTTSMEEFALQNSVQIFPNPSNGEFVIAVNDNMLGAKASIHNLLGQKVREIELNQANTKQSLTPGFYILEISKDQKHFSKKLLVE